jgi:hypothetical protein
MPLGIKRWWSAQAQAQPQAQSHTACRQAAAWARAHGHVFRSVLAEGFVVEGQTHAPSEAHLRAKDPATRSRMAPAAGAVPWRMEWGPSKRHYITQQELRLRSEPVFDKDLQLLLINRCLKDHMERSVFELFVEGVQTRIDTATPPEMRWLVLLPTVPGCEVPGLGADWVAVASHKAALLQWVAGGLPNALAQCTADASQPVVLMVSRGQLSLRTELVEADLGRLQDWSRFFETALHAAVQLGAHAITQAPTASSSKDLAATATV